MGNTFGYHFDIAPPAGQTSRQCLIAVRDFLAGWVTGHYTQTLPARVRQAQKQRRGVKARPQPLAVPPDLFHGASYGLLAGAELSGEHWEGQTHAMSAVRWTRPAGPPNESAVAWAERLSVWKTTLAVACDARSVQVALEVRGVLEDVRALRPSQVRPNGHVMPTFDGLLPELTGRWACTYAGWPVPTVARVFTRDTADEFARQTLLNPARALPVVLIGPRKGNVPSRPDEPVLVKAQNLLLGLAHLAAARDEAAAARLAQVVGLGSISAPEEVRIYWPGLTAGVNTEGWFWRRCGKDLGAAVQHFYLMLAELNAKVADDARIFLDAIEAHRKEEASAAERREADAAAAAKALDAARLERDAARSERDAMAARTAGLTRKLADAAAERAALVACASAPRDDALVAELERVWDENASLRAELDAQRRRGESLAVDLRAARDELGASRQLRPAADPAAPAGESDDRSFASVADALRAAAEEFADVLAVWDDARQSAAASAFAVPGQAYRALQAVAGVGRDYFQSLDGGPALGPVERAFSARVPFKYTSHESQTTLSMYGFSRVFHHQGQARLMQRHLTLGGGQTNNCLQIYFEFDDHARRVCVGYCGKHLPFHRQRS